MLDCHCLVIAAWRYSKRGGGKGKESRNSCWALADGFGERFVPKRVKASLPNDYSAVNQIDIF